MNLDSKIAIVTGASSGLGAAIAESLIQENTTVFGIGRNSGALQKMKSILGEQFKPVILDLTQREEVRSWFRKTFSENFTPDILINNAGSGVFTRIDEMEDKIWDAMIDTNLTGMYNITSEAVRLMRKTPASSHTY